MAESVIYRYEVPVDDHWHGYDLTGSVLHVGARRVDVVEFWAAHVVGAPQARHEFRVFGTGQPLDGGAYLGTVVHSSLVWHLFVRTRRQHDPGALIEEPDLYPKVPDPDDERRADDAHMAAGEAWMEHDAEQGEGDDRG